MRTALQKIIRSGIITTFIVLGVAIVAYFAEPEQFTFIPSPLSNTEDIFSDEKPLIPSLSEIFTPPNTDPSPVSIVATPTNPTETLTYQTTGTLIPKTIVGVTADSIFAFADTTTSAFHNTVTNAGVNVIQFVPGTTANYWHWQGTGLGVDEDEVMRDGASPNKTTEISWTDKYSFRFYDRFVSLVSATNTDAFISLNIMSQIAPGKDRFDEESIMVAINENLALLNDIRSQGINVVGVRIGTEIHIGGYSDIFPTVEDYIKRVKPIALAIRSSHPEIPIYLQPAPPEKTGKRLVEWNEALTKETFYDGVLTYAWLRPEDTGCSGSLTTRFACMDAMSKKFIDSTVPSNLDELRNTFPNKLIWIGQWNLATENTGAEADNTFGNTMLQALHSADYLLTLTKYTALKNGIVRGATFMNFGGANGLRNFVSNYLGGDDVNHVESEGGLVARSSAQAYAMLHGIYDGAHSLLALSPTFPSHVSSDDAKLYGFKGKNDYIFVIINRSGLSIPLSEITSSNTPIFDPLKTVTLETLYGPSLSSTYGAKGHDGAFSPIVHSDPLNTVAGTVSIKPFSVTRISF